MWWHDCRSYLVFNLRLFEEEQYKNENENNGNDDLSSVLGDWSIVACVDDKKPDDDGIVRQRDPLNLFSSTGTV